MKSKITKLYKWLINFGPLFTMRAIYNTIVRGKYDFDALNHTLYEKYLHQHVFRKITKKYKEACPMKENTTLTKFPIWVCWFQGGGTAS